MYVHVLVYVSNITKNSTSTLYTTVDTSVITQKIVDQRCIDLQFTIRLYLIVYFRHAILSSCLYLNQILDALPISYSATVNKGYFYK